MKSGRVINGRVIRGRVVCVKHGREGCAACVPLEEAIAAQRRLAELEDFARDCRDNWDCDEDAHRLDTRCRACAAGKLLPASVGGEALPPTQSKA